jgi:hypothetical protein
MYRLSLTKDADSHQKYTLAVNVRRGLEPPLFYVDMRSLPHTSLCSPSWRIENFMLLELLAAAHSLTGAAGAGTASVSLPISTIGSGLR